MSEIIPCGSAGAVVLADRPPLSLAEIRTPATPIFCAFAAFFDAALFGVSRLRHGFSPPFQRLLMFRRAWSARPARASAKRRECRRQTRPAPGRREDGAADLRRKSRRWYPPPGPSMRR